MTGRSNWDSRWVRLMCKWRSIDGIFGEEGARLN